MQLNNIKTCFIIILIVLLTGVYPCQADDPDTVNLKFQQFVREWVVNIQASYLYSQATPEVIEKDNYCIARYYHLDETSIKTEVKKADGLNQIYTGVLQYNEYLFQSTGKTRNLCETGKFSVQSMKQMTEIFLYEKGSWVR